MDVRDRLREHIFTTLIPLERGGWPGDDADLFDAGMDSLRIMQLLVYIEREMGVNLPDHEVTPERIASIDALAEWIGSHGR